MYWIYNSDINTSNIVLYIDYPSFLGRYEELNQKEEEEKIEKLEKQKGIKCIKIWELKKFEKKELYKNLKKKIKQISDKSYLDKILLSKSIELLDKIEFWHSFFEKYNIKIHMDPHDESIDNVVKQIGMYLVGGCSVGKYKSCLNKSDAINYGYYPNDVFCCWGKASIDHIKTKVKKKTLSNINNILITGYPYGYINKKEKLKIESIKNDLHKNGARFILLLLDTSSAYNNKNYDQVFPNDLLNKFYNFFLNWVIKDKEIGLIIKPKKLKILRSLNNSKNLIKDSTDTGRCYIHEKPFQSIPWHYSEISNMVVALTVDALPTALMECIINNKKIRGVFFDYPNLRKIESDLYLWGENKVVFDNMDKMMESIKKFKSNTNEDLGCWKEEFVNNLNTFKDNKGNIRVGNYVNDLIANFNANLNRNDAIKLANKKFSEKWGEKNTLIFKD